MTDEQWERLRPFAEAEAMARNVWMAVQAMNAQTEPRKRIEQQAYFERVRLEFVAAGRAMDDARRRVLGE